MDDVGQTIMHFYRSLKFSTTRARYVQVQDRTRRDETRRA